MSNRLTETSVCKVSKMAEDEKVYGGYVEDMTQRRNKIHSMYAQTFFASHDVEEYHTLFKEIIKDEEKRSVS